MKTIDAYVLRKTLGPLLACIAIALVAMLLERMLRLLDFMVDKGGPFYLVLKMLANLIPHYLGLAIPDPDLRWNEEKGGYDFTEPDWTEFYDVLAGNGPCNKDRLGARVKAWEDGAWFREGLVAHAEKAAARAPVAAE